MKKILVHTIFLASVLVTNTYALEGCGDTGIEQNQVRVINYIKGPSFAGRARIYYNHTWLEFGASGSAAMFYTAPLTITGQSFYYAPPFEHSEFKKYPFPDNCFVTVPGGSTLVIQGDTNNPDQDTWNIHCSIIN